MSEEKKEAIKESDELKAGFFKKIGQSITKIEKYPDMAAQGVGKAISYMMKIVAILAIVLCLGTLYQVYQMIGEGINYLKNEFPEFSYEEGILKIESENPIIIESKNSVAGKVIIDTSVEDENKVNEYTKNLQEAEEGILILKDKMVLKSMSTTGTITYDYKTMLEQMGITKFEKQDVINYANSPQVASLYVSIFLTIFIYSFIMYLLTTLSNAMILSAFGYLTSIIAKIRMRYVAIFNMSIYALTLSIILNILYIAVNIFIDFNIQYFQVMYITVATIYLVAAIFLLKMEFMKKQMELMKIAEAQAIIQKELDKQGKKEEKQEEKKENEKNKKEQDEEEQKDSGEEPEGSKA